MKVQSILWMLSVMFVVGCSTELKHEDMAVEKNAVVEDSVKTLQDSIVSKIAIKMEKSGGVFTVPCNVNGLKMNFIFDTGASNVCISLTEALFMYKNGYIEEADILGKSLSQIADGRIVENTEINLHSIEIDGIIITDVKALVANSIGAPLLLGQSAIQKLGTIEMKGDSLFIMKKTAPKDVVSNTQRKVGTSSVESLPEPDRWDDVKAFFGSDCKIEKYLDKSMDAYNKGLNKLAYKYAQEALECDDENWKSYAVLGMLEYNEHNWEVTKSFYEKYYKLNSNKETLSLLNGNTSLTYKMTMYHYACALARCEDFSDCIQIAEEIIVLYPDYYQIYYPIAHAYCMLGKYDKADFWARKMLESDAPNDKSSGYFSLAYIAHEQGKINDAIRFYEKCIEIDSENDAAYNNLAILYSEKGYHSYAKELRIKAAKLGSEKSIEWLKEKGINW